ncbi:unnamed protein product [Parascedosporium putredinis]|uniref:MTHFR SAM-binding regulatory domain-containing protein n=1 Tax=Parascedosporium putredinis TaxID=1442378 RepID=A0A9P1GW27_9PEZI|nr:unnamed protein product [Parascedosporium putredinis]CAI7988394.1 unnamed protein product [Parascedosporium putredinis]
MSTTQAIELWGTPTSVKDVSDIFLRHLQGTLAAIPWSEEGLLPETNAIHQHLVNLNNKGWWSVASQPAVNGFRSSDHTFGWGPENGFVFQKSFVEFFLPTADWNALRAKLQDPAVHESICFYAANVAGDFESSDAAAASPGGSLTPSTNAVTWGEIITPTIIEEVSFRAWSEEAFGIWAEWARVYGKGSESEKLLDGIRKDYWLVNIIHHEFIDGEALWKLLDS